MRSRTNLTLVVIVAVFTTWCLTSYCPAAGKAKPVVTEPNEPNAIALPYIAEIAEDNVNIRSGPGTNFYSCSKLNKADKVEVVATQFSWSQIVPPPTCFAWISKQYVSIDANSSASGTVTGDAVRVYAGDETGKPIRSTTVLVKLNRGDVVTMLGQPEGEYYKIVPPDGSYLWISTNYTKPIGPAAGIERHIPMLVPTNLSAEAQKLAEYYILEKQLRAEKEKPIAEQNYDALKKAFIEITGNKESGKAARYSEYAIKQIEQCELAKLVGKEAELQDSQFQQTKQKIEQARDAKLAEVPDLSNIAAIGKLQVSNIYIAQNQGGYYRLVDDAGKTICYAAATGPAAGTDLTAFVGKNVGLVGIIEPLPHISGALVRFTQIVEVK